MPSVSYPNAGVNYATAQKLVAVPSYTQANYRPYVPPTAATAASSFGNAATYIQPTGSAPIKVNDQSRFKKKKICFILFRQFNQFIRFCRFAFFRDYSLVYFGTTNRILYCRFGTIISKIGICSISECNTIDISSIRISTEC